MGLFEVSGFCMICLVFALLCSFKVVLLLVFAVCSAFDCRLFGCVFIRFDLVVD